MSTPMAATGRAVTGGDFGEVAPRLFIAADEQLAAGDWAGEAMAALNTDGAVLLRGPMVRQDGAELALAALGGELLDDAFWSTPRTKVSGKTLTATEYPSQRTIAPHSEMAYMRSWPRFIAFHSIDVAGEGGETTICDIDRVSDMIVEPLATFREKGVTYRRTFQKRVDISWQDAFQTSRRGDVEDVGRRLDMRIEWLDGDALRTAHTAQGTIAAEDGRTIYFNQAHLFHPSSLDASVRTALVKIYGADRLPRDATYGDGSPISDTDLDRVRSAFATVQAEMRWRRGDILILDNMRFAHGRLPFTGDRRLHVALARQVTTPIRTRLTPPQ